MRLRFDGVERRGPALDLRDVAVDSGELLAAIRDPDDDRVRCGTPGPVHERIGFLRPEMAVAPVAATAAAARSRGLTSERDGDRRAVRRRLAELDAPDVDLAAARERVAATAEDVDALRERVARASGRVEALREDGGVADDAEADLAEATRALAAAETEHHAARESLAAARERARDARDTRERRLALEDRLANLRRDARRDLAAAMAGQFRRALRALPADVEPAAPADFDGPDWVAACAIARVADVTAPLVVGDGVFERATRARAALDAPVVLVEL